MQTPNLAKDTNVVFCFLFDCFKFIKFKIAQVKLVILFDTIQADLPDEKLL